MVYYCGIVTFLVYRIFFIRGQVQSLLGEVESLPAAAVAAVELLIANRETRSAEPQNIRVEVVDARGGVVAWFGDKP